MSGKSDKSNRPKARLPRGFADRTAGRDPRDRARCSRTIREVYERYGFEPLETPLHRIYRRARQVPARSGPAERRRVLASQDDDEQWLSLRYDLTAPLARYVAENYERCRSPSAATAPAGCSATRSRAPDASASSCSSTPTRSGAASPAADAEMCMMMADTMETLGIRARRLCGQGQQPQGARRRAGSHRPRRRREQRDADGAARHRQARPARASRRAAICSGAGPQGRERRLHQGRRTRSDAHRPRRGFVATGCESEAETLKRLANSSARSERGPMRALPSLQEIGGACVRAAGYGDDRIRIDPSVVRGLEYYTGPVFEAELPVEVPQREGPAGALRLGRRRRAL